MIARFLLPVAMPVPGARAGNLMRRGDKRTSLRRLFLLVILDQNFLVDMACNIFYMMLVKHICYKQYR